MPQESDNRDLDDEKDMKVSVPVWQHLLLHRLKVLTDRNIEDIVEQALCHEFKRLADEESSPVSSEGLEGKLENLAAPNEA